MQLQAQVAVIQVHLVVDLPAVAHLVVATN